MSAERPSREKKIGESFYRSLTLYTGMTQKPKWRIMAWQEGGRKSWITIRQILNIGVETINYWMNIKHVGDKNFYIEVRRTLYLNVDGRAERKHERALSSECGTEGREEIQVSVYILRKESNNGPSLNPADERFFVRAKPNEILPAIRGLNSN